MRWADAFLKCRDRNFGRQLPERGYPQTPRYGAKGKEKYEAIEQALQKLAREGWFVYIVTC